MSISEHPPILGLHARAMDAPHQFSDAKKLHGKGTNRQTHRTTDIASTRKNRPKVRFFENIELLYLLNG